MKRLTYFQVHKNKKPKKLPFFIGKDVIDKCYKDMIHKYNLLLLMQEDKSDF